MAEGHGRVREERQRVPLRVRGLFHIGPTKVTERSTEEAAG